MNIVQIALKGSGYFCNVKQVREEESGNSYALKELKKEHFDNDDYKNRLHREIELLRVLSESTNIIELIDSFFDETNKKLYYLMPYANFNLHEYVKNNNQKLSNEDRFSIIEQIISAIKFAHSKSVLHRDLSPNNILVFQNSQDNRPSIKVSDFGLGKNEESLSFYTHSSASGYGQALYVSPEQREKLKDSTIKSDIYSLGKVIYFIWTGKDPIDLKNCGFSSLISKAINEDPKDRFQNIEELEKSYLRIKKVMVSQSIPDEYKTLNDLASNMSVVDWHQFHQLALVEVNFNSVYSSYVSPVVQILNTNQNLEKYYRELGNELKDFTIFFCSKLVQCLSTTGWPFKATSEFGSLLKRIYLLVKSEEVELLCLKHLWLIGYKYDQWSVQSDFKNAIIQKEVKEYIAPQLGEFIVESEVECDLSSFEGVKLPIFVKVSIIEGDSAAKEKREKKKKDDYLDLF
ncbi:serine/threonine-protein kinase [Haliscomenobacter hydrossis]|uniref:Serine/threonine protein kinase n=1 Tax=Haliscomenobacter hydrossis (strain ATCC 27775 / DSM 1100 / LMG 10767 / O) TaxID=760192 RepID=F4L6Q9_HALH1|nr:serine/threonine-protein kinase [Haliscomenobacter hydrossis]AEE50890.1 serine/threonine protein kinase [Haliscomenobacter hydrossis DSM 1100]